MYNQVKMAILGIGLIVAGTAVSLHAGIRTVSKTGTADYHSIQAAVDVAVENDTIVIKDSEVYEECVTIAFKKKLTIKGGSPLSSAPTIEFMDTVNVGPNKVSDAHDSSKTTFMKNGALRILESSDISIEGLAISGKSSFVFGYPEVWNDGTGAVWPHQGGNASITIFQSYNILIDKCSIRDAFFGILITATQYQAIASYNFHAFVPMDATIGYTGNYMIQNNHIHHNTFGIFTEGDNDMGTVIHHNFFYDNRYANDTIAKKVNTLTSEGPNLPGGSIRLKNCQKTPIAIYNNTFYNNSLLLVAHWRPGRQYLIFNNIYARPYQYWSLDTILKNSYLVYDPVFTFRTHNCVYACQADAPRDQIHIIKKYDTQNNNYIILDTITTYQARIMNGMGNIETTSMDLSYRDFDTVLTGVKIPGNKVVGSSGRAFPKDADIRWLEPKFKSVDPSNAEFLVPDWSDSLSALLIVNKGWVESGIRDNDGSVADIGAISSDITANSTKIRVVPVAYITDSMPDKMSFVIETDVSLSDCKIEYCKFIDNSSLDTNGFGSNIDALPLSAIHNVRTSGEIAVGFNQVSCEITDNVQSLKYGFFELVVSGVTTLGKRVSSAPGFLPVAVPYKKSDFAVSFRNLGGGSELTGKFEFVLSSRPGLANALFLNASLRKNDGTPVNNIHGKSIQFDSLNISSEIGSVNGSIRYADTFTIESVPRYGIVPVFFSAFYDNKMQSYYSSHILKIGNESSIKNNPITIRIEKIQQKVEFAALYNLMGKRIAVIPYGKYLNRMFPNTVPKGIYVVRFLQASKKEVDTRNTSKVVIR